MPDSRSTKQTGFTAEERAAMRAHAKEMKAEAEKADGEMAVQEALAKMEGLDRAMGTKLHGIIKEAAPMLLPKTWYGMPAYANAEGKVVCFFQNSGKFGARYSTLGFNDAATLDDGEMWPVTYALMSLGDAEEAKIKELLKKATK